MKGLVLGILIGWNIGMVVIIFRDNARDKREFAEHAVQVTKRIAAVKSLEKQAYDKGLKACQGK